MIGGSVIFIEIANLSLHALSDLPLLHVLLVLTFTIIDLILIIILALVLEVRGQPAWLLSHNVAVSLCRSLPL